MAGYGFRLYTVKLVTGRQKSKAIEFDKCGVHGDEHVGVWIRRALERLETYEPLTGPPVMHHAVDEPELEPIAAYVRDSTRGEYRTKFVEHTATPATRIRFKLEYGRTGKVSVGVQDGGAMDLHHIATGDAYRGILYLPETGTQGLLALESVPSAPNPQRMLNAWLARAAIDLEAEDTAALGEQGTKKAKPHPFKLNFNQYPNLDRIEKAVAHDSAAKVVLRKELIDGAATQSQDEVTLVSTMTQQKRNVAAKLAAGLVRKATGKMGDDEEPVTIEDLEGLVEGSLEGIEWTEGYIQIDDETGLKKIGLEHIDRFFVYPLRSSVQVDDDRFERLVAAEVVDLQSMLGLELDLA